MAEMNAAEPAVRIGRAPATTHGELSHVALRLFLERGFDATTVDDIAIVAGISRRTFFRYFPSKNDLPWGEFDLLLDGMRMHLANAHPDLSLTQALRQAILSFNTYPDSELPHLRNRMYLLLHVPSLTAHSTLRYAAWRQVIAEYVAEQRCEDVGELAPQAIAWACLGLCLSAYERWLVDERQDLLTLLNDAFDTVESVFGALQPAGSAAP